MPLATKYNGTYEQALGYNTLIIKLKNMHAFCQFGLFNVKPNHFIFLFRVFFKCNYLYKKCLPGIYNRKVISPANYALQAILAGRPLDDVLIENIRISEFLLG